MSSPAPNTLSVGFISLGCAKNLVDSQTMAEGLLDADIVLAPSAGEADVVIVNTCAFIEAARAESDEMILEACGLKAAGNCRAVLVAGCMPQRYRDDIADTYPDVDAFIGLDELDKLGDIVRRIVAGTEHIVEVSSEPRRLFEPGERTVIFTGGPFAYLKIAEGCNHRCGFCAIPAIRGVHRSRSIESVVGEASSLLSQGFRELNIISQDVTAYGLDSDGAHSLPGLLTALGRLDQDFWVRLLYGYPTGVTDELLETMARTPQVCEYLDIPIQHSHPDILRAMRRTETIESVNSLVARVRDALPGAALRTTCLVGYPGETDAHFEHLLAFIREMRFDHLGAFTFSPEQDTYALDLPDPIPFQLAEERSERLMQAQKEIVDARASALVGHEARILLEHPAPDEEGIWIGRSRRLAPEVDGAVIVGGVPNHCQPGDLVTVQYTEACDYDMLAQTCET